MFKRLFGIKEENRKFGLDEVFTVLAEIPDLSKREAQVGASFVGVSGINVTVVEEVQTKEAELHGAIQSAEQGITTTVTRLEELPKEADEMVGNLKRETEKETERLRNVADNHKGLVNGIADRRAEKLRKKIYKINHHADIQKCNIDCRAEESIEKFKTRQHTKIDTLVVQFNQELTATKEMLACLRSQLTATRADLNEVTKVKELFS